MQALILAAGNGTRLGGASGAGSKCLREIGGRSLINRQLDILRAAGVESTVVVTGFDAESVKRSIEHPVRFVHNNRFRETNSLYSFWLARRLIAGSTLVLNCDVLFHAQVLDRLLATKQSAVTYDSTSGQEPEHMKVTIKGDRLLEMNKFMPQKRVCGENVGIIRLEAAAARAAFRCAGAIVKGGSERDWLGRAVNEIAKDCPVKCVDVAGLPWIEIDFPEDLEAARTKVWPRIAVDRDAAFSKTTDPPQHAYVAQLQTQLDGGTN